MQFKTFVHWQIFCYRIESEKYGLKTLRHLGLKIWNTVPSDIKNPRSLQEFKKKKIYRFIETALADSVKITETCFYRHSVFYRQLQYAHEIGCFSLILCLQTYLAKICFVVTVLQSKRLSIVHLVRVQKLFRKTNIPYHVIRTRTCAYHGVRNVSFRKIFRNNFFYKTPSTAALLNRNTSTLAAIYLAK